VPLRKQLQDKGLTPMHAAYIVITLITAAATAGIAVADLIPARFVLANSAEVGVPRSWIPPLAAAKLAGAAGLVVGLVALPALGIAAAVGLVLFFVGAVITHLRARVIYNIAFPGAYLCLSAATLVLMVAR
jgi:predicted ATPase